MSPHTSRNGHHNNQQTTSAGEDVEEREPQCTVGGNADWGSHCGKQYGLSSKKQKRNCLLTQQFHCWGYTVKNPETPIQNNLCVPVFIAAQFTIAKC